MTQELEFMPSPNRPSRTGKLWFMLVVLAIAASIFAASPAVAARLDSWRFERDRNQLNFRTTGNVQPKAQLLSNPTRLIIDLPGTRLGRTTVRERVGGTIREIRIGQFERQTSRIVVELAEGYTLNPDQIQFRGSSPSQWTVQLPTPQREVAISPTQTPVPPPPAVTVNSTLLQGIEVLDEGFILRTSGPTPEIDLRWSTDRTWVTLDLPEVKLSPEITERIMTVDRLGVNRLEAIQISDSPLLSRVLLNLNDTRRNWQAQVTDLGEIVIWPEGGTPPQSSSLPSLATIQSVELANDGTSVVVNSDRPVGYKTEWDIETLAYKITLFSSQLAEAPRELRTPSQSSLLWVRTIEEDPETVVVLVQPAAGIRVGEISQPSGNQLLVRLQPESIPEGPVQTPPVVAVGERSLPIAVPPPTTQTPAPPTQTPAPSTPRVPTSRRVVVIDAGHGGSDPGAVGIGGLREKEVVLDISRQVSEILEQNGVTVVMTRQDDRTLGLASRTQLANRVNANLFVSIHANAISMSRPDVNGLETFYYRSGQQLAQRIQRSMLRSFPNMRDRGVRRARFYVLRHTNMPAVLVETGFVTGRDDARMLANPTQRTRMAEAIAQGILQYIREAR
ncbi:N-acetylmuramoyl-L-alanine amidase [Oscillatoria sp. HE19RPO]|uniref:N-acetylmuramoyl-L-alanine amidase n=1 Tax=Oscillatoria sp. HE19RPO TaxID=2954806 RepID=UPI0020C263B3|nr:N-acetylmuramoyl-L-alanine amidase [Oscillatoria sp. HE19RPO]